MKTLSLLFILILLSSSLAAQKKEKQEKKPWFYEMIEYRDNIHIGQCEVSYSDWFAFLYDKYLDGEVEAFEHLIPEVKKYESKILWDFFLQNWGLTTESSSIKIKNSIVRYEIWIPIGGTLEIFNIKKYLEFPITGLSKTQIDQYLRWYEDIQKEIYLDGFDNWQITVSLPSLELYQDLKEGVKRGTEAIGDSVNLKGCQIFNFHSESPCEGSEGRIKLYGGINGLVASNDFFPDKNGLYSIVGNASEMTDSGNVSCGGNYAQYAKTIFSTKSDNINPPDTLVGFRVMLKLSKVE